MSQEVQSFLQRARPATVRESFPQIVERGRKSLAQELDGPISFETGVPDSLVGVISVMFAYLNTGENLSMPPDVRDHIYESWRRVSVHIREQRTAPQDTEHKKIFTAITRLQPQR